MLKFINTIFVVISRYNTISFNQNLCLPVVFKILEKIPNFYFPVSFFKVHIHNVMNGINL